MIRRILTLLAVSALSACTSNAVAKLPVTSVDPLAGSTLQFAVGTYNDPQAQIVDPSSANPSLNVVATFRNAAGQSAVLTDSISIFGPSSFVAGAANTNYDGGLPNQILKSVAGDHVFGDSFGLIDPSLDANNSVANQTGPPPTLNQFAAGPPAWPIINNGLNPQQLTGYPESVLTAGVRVANSAIAPVLGPWTLQVTVPNGSLVPPETANATATLKSLAALPNFSKPVFTPDGNGGGSVQIVVPPGVTEAFVNISTGNQICYPPLPVQNQLFNQVVSNYTLMTKTPGPQTLVLPDNLGPPDPTTGQPLHSICTSSDDANHPLNPNGASPPYNYGTTFFVRAVGVDYPAYEMAYPQSTSSAPQIVGANGQADVTLSPQAGPLVYP